MQAVLSCSRVAGTTSRASGRRKVLTGRNLGQHFFSFSEIVSEWCIGRITVLAAWGE